ncbi:PREDICTED: transcription factor HY5 isoform X2 [Tarenaya hassleriana]|uniref:transcription factor HY5 isoform X2 n=1 Tax=Tarenaya hassleriana TaxID=28532 RepID=UPI00053C8A79|nr:PREDICTED: transcription factor HY5 isoform X2 [Tarenaya hassleriana]
MEENDNNKSNGEEQGMFLTLASPSMPVPLAPKSFQVWRETTPPPQPSDSNLTVLVDSSADDGGESSGPKKLGFINYEVEPGLTIRLRHNIDYDMDPRKLKRVISNRVSAQKSRIKKLQYVADLEKKHKELEMQVAVLRPQVATAREHKRFAEMEQRDLNLRIAACNEHYRRTEATGERI